MGLYQGKHSDGHPVQYWHIQCAQCDAWFQSSEGITWEMHTNGPGRTSGGLPRGTWWICLELRAGMGFWYQGRMGLPQ